MKLFKSTLRGLGAAILTIACVQQLAAGEYSSIGEEAFIYGYPMVMAYDVINQFSINKESGQYKAPFNVLSSEARVFTPADTAVVTPNSDTPYSFAALDLRAEPMVICVPEIEKERYYSIQLVSLYTFNFGYIGSRATGNKAGCYAIVGPEWKGETLKGVDQVIRSETEFALAIFRTQLFNAADIDNVKKVQSGYKLLPLSKFQNTTPPPAAPVVQWPKIDKPLIAANPFTYLNFLLQFAPTVGAAAVEKPMRAQFEQLGIIAGKPLLLNKLTAEQKDELELGMKTGLQKIKRRTTELGEDVNGWRFGTSGFGNRAEMKNDWTLRAALAMAGIFGNDAAEALYPMTRVDSSNEPLDGSKHNYTLTFKELPPVNAFWSVTMYDGDTQLLINNPLNRYLINSPMLPSMQKNADGSLTLYIQKDSPGKDKESNWLPAPNGPIYLVMRLYWPKESALNGSWKPPGVVRIQ